MAGRTPQADTLAVNQSALLSLFAMARRREGAADADPPVIDPASPPPRMRGTILFTDSTALSRTTVSSTEQMRSRMGRTGSAREPGMSVGTSAASWSARTRRISSSASPSPVVGSVSPPTTFAAIQGRRSVRVESTPMALATTTSRFMASARASEQSVDIWLTNRSMGEIAPRDSGERGRDRARARLGTPPEKAPPVLDGMVIILAAMVSGLLPSGSRMNLAPYRCKPSRRPEKPPGALKSNDCSQCSSCILELQWNEE
mmetsp:Transcript_4876/g.13852  ORF Transcript_4876/g.13852 Transcript_4876/m.13852 type:complete len:259 (+) Transcript_4876:1838-2614(+)